MVEVLDGVEAASGLRSDLSEFRRIAFALRNEISYLPMVQPLLTSSVMVATRALFTLVVLVPAVAAAKPRTAGETATDSDDGADRGAHSRVCMTLGLFTPIGELGFEYALVLPYLEIGVGVGGGGYGAQASIMPRLHLEGRDASVSVGAGISGGPYDEPVLLCLSDDADACKATKTTVLWGNVEAGIARKWDGGGSLRLYGGVGRLLDHAGCTGPHCAGINGDTLPYFGLSIGHTL
jgi:hypothetical protein